MAEEFGIPTEKEIEALPRWARVAFAARCARRVQPLFTHPWPDAPAEYANAVARAIIFAQTMAADPIVTSDARDYLIRDYLIGASIQAGDAAARTAAVAATATNVAEAANYAARSASHTYDAAARADSARAAVSTAVRAAVTAADAAKEVRGDYAAIAYANKDAFEPTVAAMRLDYELLKAAAEREKWNDNTPVPPEFFGPLWPDGEPEGWPKETNEEEEPVNLVIEIEVPDDVTDEEIASRLVDLASEMDGMHRSLGGGGLKIKGVNVEVDVDAPAGVPS